ncbi:ComEC/Rec2 family competence protein [Neobacillus cucumis]|uniref:ComEC/Rec2 family competence protein n=1 Tax=Neobacillus cucumis TaxID=1740721 RepID=UPI002E202931|nr:ComEC/Rec2 family competence protein [Neobacillus cucumis]
MKKTKWLLPWILMLSFLGTACSEQTTNRDSKVTTAAAANQSTNPTDEKLLKVYYFDVGQGDSIYIKTPAGEDVLIDGGNNDKGEDVVRYLKSLHVSDLEAVIATHPDADHIGGLDTVLQSIKVKAVYTPKIINTTQTYEDFLIAVKNAGLKLKEAKAGVNLGLKDVDAKFVAPVKNYGNEMNDWSAVAKLTYGENSFLFTGDAPIRSEEDMIVTHQDLQADVLKVGHHGASTSTSQSFLDAVKPKYAVISVGQGNRYGHPTDEVLTRLKQNGIQIFRTDKMQTILALADGKTIQFKSVPALTPGNYANEQVQPTPIPDAKQKTSVVANAKEPASVQLHATLDNVTPEQYHTIHLTVTGIAGASYTATVHYKSSDTEYTGEIGTPLPIKISRAASGYEVVIDITANVNGKTYSTQTSFVPQ